MRKGLTEIVFILDRSGSMSGLEADTIGGAIRHIGNVHKYAREEDRPEKTLFIITTDGMENASRQYNYEKVRQMVERQKENFGWEFLFLGANIDAIDVAGRFGIAPERAVNYECDSRGTQLNYQVVSQAVTMMRCAPTAAQATGMFDEKDLLKEIRNDHEKRRKRR